MALRRRFVRQGPSVLTPILSFLDSKVRKDLSSLTPTSQSRREQAAANLPLPAGQTSTSPGSWRIPNTESGRPHLLPLLGRPSKFSKGCQVVITPSGFPRGEDERLGYSALKGLAVNSKAGQAERR
jgi:hypothetical protein